MRRLRRRGWTAGRPARTGSRSRCSCRDGPATVLVRRCDEVQAGLPRLGQTPPVGGRRCTCLGQCRQCLLDLLEAEADVLGRSDEGDPTQHVAVVAALATGRSRGFDELFTLVVTVAWTVATPARSDYIADRQGKGAWERFLDLKLTLSNTLPGMMTAIITGGSRGVRLRTGRAPSRAKQTGTTSSTGATARPPGDGGADNSATGCTSWRATSPSMRTGGVDLHAAHNSGS